MPGESPKPTPANTEQVRAAHLQEALSMSLSTDGTVAMMVFKIADGSKFAITVDAQRTKWFRDLVGQLVKMVEAKGRGAGNILMVPVTTYETGHSDQMRGRTFLHFDKELPTEAMFHLANRDALQLAQSVERSVLSRMTMQERRDLTMVRKGPSIIIPGR